MPDTTKNRSLPRGETNRTVKTCGKEVLPDVPGQAAKQPTMFFLRVRNAANQLVTGSSRISEEMRDLRRARGRQVCQACATVFGMILLNAALVQILIMVYGLDQYRLDNENDSY